MQDDDFGLGSQHRPWPKTMQKTKRLLKTVLGFILLATLGLVDDALVIITAARANLRAISSFRNWEGSFK